MSAALKLLERFEAVSKPIARRSDLTCKFMGREVRVEVVARYWRLCERRRKDAEAIEGAAKRALKSVGVGEYAGVRVSHQNRFKEVQCAVEDVIEAIGEVQYRHFFDDSGIIDFGGVEALRRFVKRCEMAGVHVDGEVRERVKPKKDYRVRYGEIEGSLGDDVRKLLSVLVVDSDLTVTRVKRRVK